MRASRFFTLSALALLTAAAFTVPARSGERAVCQAEPCDRIAG